jgi:RNA polymerase sigma-70 factor (ECF subfamily)
MVQTNHLVFQCPGKLGDCPSVERLYRTYAHQLLRYGLRIAHDENLVRDAVQEIFLRLAQQAHRLSEIGNPKTYLFVALKNYLIRDALTRNTHRRHQQRYALNQQLTEEPRYAEGGDNELGDQVKVCLAAIDRLPARERDILRMRYLQGYDYKEISSVVGSNHQVTRNSATRAIKRVRTEVQRQFRRCS